MTSTKTIVTLGFMLLALACSKSGPTGLPAKVYEWESTTSGTTADLGSISFPTATVGYVAAYTSGTGSFLLKTTDGGATRTNSAIVSPRFLSSVAFTSSTTGYYVGDSGYVFKTTDGGATWDGKKAGTSLLWSVSFPSNQTGYAAGNFSIVKTTDAGATWSVLGTDKDGAGLSFVNDSVGIVVGAAIYRTTDGGASWSTVAVPSGTFVTSVRHASASVVYATDHGGNVRKSTDGGVSWTLTNVGVTSALRSVWTMDISHVVVCGDGGVIRVSSNGGSSWQAETTPTSQLLDEIVFTPSGTGIAVGFSGTILKRR